MNDGVDELIAFSKKIYADEISFEEAEKEANRLESRYGEKIFNPYIFEKKPKPWTRKYYEELKSLSITGASSKEFLLHMAEVKDSLKASAKRKKLIAALLIGVAVILELLIWFLIR